MEKHLLFPVSIFPDGSPFTHTPIPNTAPRESQCSQRLIALFKYPKGDCSKSRVGLFSLVTGRGEMASSCARGALGWISGKTTERVVKHWNRLPREVVESPSLDVFKNCLDVVLRDMI